VNQTNQANLFYFYEVRSPTIVLKTFSTCRWYAAYLYARHAYRLLCIPALFKSRNHMLIDLLLKHPQKYLFPQQIIPINYICKVFVYILSVLGIVYGLLSYICIWSSNLTKN
jgi:hypothetical protein